jgi:hypothetical protein
MANTGYLINPKVIQVFKNGPNSGSVVDEDFNIEFNISSSFTSSLLCNSNLYEYKTLNLNLCPLPTGSSEICVPPLLNNIICEDNTDFNLQYVINFNENIYISSSDYIIEYSLNNQFLNTGSQQININIINPNNNYIIDISDLNPTPLNITTPIYFRIKRICNTISSSYSQIQTSTCSISNLNYLVILHRDQTFDLACLGNPIDTNTQCIGVTDSFCGLPYYINTNNFETANLLYLNNNNTLALEGWYSDGVVSRYWDGNNFIYNVLCQ